MSENIISRLHFAKTDLHSSRTVSLWQLSFLSYSITISRPRRKKMRSLNDHFIDASKFADFTR